MSPTTQDVGEAPSVVAAVSRYRWLIVLAAVIGGLVAYGASELQPVVYEGTTEVFLSDPSSSSVFREVRPAQDANRYVRNQARLMESSTVLRGAAERAGIAADIDSLRERVDIEVPASDVDVVTIRARAGSAARAAALANAVAEAYEGAVVEDVQGRADAAIAELEGSVQALRANLASLEQRIAAEPENASLEGERSDLRGQIFAIESRVDEIAVDTALFGTGVDHLEAATPPRSPIQPRPRRNAAAGVVIALGLAVTAAWWRAGQRQVARGKLDPAGILRAPLLGEIPDFKSVGIKGHLPTVEAPRSLAGEAYQYVVGSLKLALDRADGRSLLVTSPLEGDGKTVTALNLAIAASRDQKPVLLVDADDRARGLSQLLDLNDRAIGLSDLADDRVPLGWALQSGKFQHGEVALSVRAVGAGKDVGDSASFFRSTGFRHAMTRLNDVADLIIVDSPPLLVVSETSVIASQVDGLVLVVNRGTSMQVLQNVRNRLDFIGVELLGYVFNRAVPEETLAGVSSRYHYGSAPEQQSNGAKERRKRKRVRARALATEERDG